MLNAQQETLVRAAFYPQDKWTDIEKGTFRHLQSTKQDPVWYNLFRGIRSVASDWAKYHDQKGQVFLEKKLTDAGISVPLARAALRYVDDLFMFEMEYCLAQLCRQGASHHKVDYEQFMNIWKKATGREPDVDSPEDGFAFICSAIGHYFDNRKRRRPMTKEDELLHHGMKEFCRLWGAHVLKLSPQGLRSYQFPVNMGLDHRKWMQQFLEMNSVKPTDIFKPSKPCDAFEGITRDCPKDQGAKIFTLQDNQRFLARYLTVENPFKGLYVFHSPGSGKTCALTAAASNTFARDEWAIVWVTRRSLRDDVTKNTFKNVCNVVFQELMRKNPNLKIPTDDKERQKFKKKYNKWFLTPQGYRTFTNFMLSDWPSSLNNGEEEDVSASAGTLLAELIAFQREKKNKIKRADGTIDMLRQVLVIFDECHRLFAREDSPAAQKGIQYIQNGELLEMRNRIYESYRVSGKDSCKLAMLTGTPMCSHPMDFFLQFNWLLDPSHGDRLFPEELGEFEDRWLDSSHKDLSADGKRMFLDITKGRISYLNRTQDGTRFPLVSVVSQVKVKLPDGQIIQEKELESKAKIKLNRVLDQFDEGDFYKRFFGVTKSKKGKAATSGPTYSTSSFYKPKEGESTKTKTKTKKKASWFSEPESGSDDEEYGYKSKTKKVSWSKPTYESEEEEGGEDD